MIRVRLVPEDVRPQSSDRRLKSLRIADGREEPHPLAGQPLGGLAGSGQSLDEVVRFMGRRDDDGTWVDAPEPLEERVERVECFVRLRDDDDMRAPQGGERLAHGSPRQERPAAQRHAGAHEHNIAVARKAPMLKPVVEQDRLRAELRAGHLSGVVASRPDENGHPVEMPGEQLRLIRQPLRVDGLSSVHE